MALTGAGVDIQFDLSTSISELTVGLSGSPKEVNVAIDRAIKKLLKWLERQVLRQVSRDNQITQKSLKTRVSAKYLARDKFGYVFMGLNPLPAHLAGKPTQKKKGVTVGRGKHNFQGAFYQSVFGDDKKIWRRKYTGPGSSGKGVSGGRFPVVMMRIDLERQGEKVARRLKRKAEQRFEILLEQELNFALK